MVAKMKSFTEGEVVVRPGRVSRNDGEHLKFVEDKELDMAMVGQFLSASKIANHWSNFGPVASRLEKKIAQDLNLSEDLRVVMCASGTAALHAVVSLHETIADRPLRWATSSFGFYTSVQGPLQHADIVDCNSQGMLDLDKIDPEDFDGFVVTNVFGQADNLQEYYRYAATHGKIMCVDAALSYGSHTHGANECISFHHTKPWGFGEGGCAIVAREHEQLLRSLICFGHEPGLDINRRATNGKISDVSAAFALMRLKHMERLRAQYRMAYKRIANAGLAAGLKVLSGVREHPGIPASVPFLCPKPREDFKHPSIPTGRYYHPLADTPMANAIYNRIINVPCHPGMAKLSDMELFEALAFFAE